LIKLLKPNRPTRRISPSIPRGILAIALFFCLGKSTFAQASSQLPHAWSEAVYALAQKAAAALGTGRAFSAEVKDVSAAAPVELADIRRAFEDDMTVRGMRPTAAAGDAQVEISISDSLTGFELVAEIHRADAQQLAVVPVASGEAVAPQPGPEPGLQRKIIWQQAEQLLDFDQVSADANRAFWYFLEPDRLVVYEFDGGQQVLRDAQPISRRYAARDLRGWIQAPDATRVNAFVGGARCDAFWNPSLALECQENSGQQWPMGPVSWTFTPGRNYFSGTVTLSSSLQAKFPPFYSSASPLPDTSGQGPSRRVVAEVEGQAQFFESGADPVSTFDGWGSDIVSIASGCGSGWQVLATGAGDWTQKDQIQLYEIRDTKAIAIGQPLELPGPTLVIWPTDDGKSARVISRNLESGLYEASIVSIRCGN
jgi:hypothetical protein